MNIKATLARLGSTMVNSHAARDLLLLPGAQTDLSTQSSDITDSIDSNTINIVVGYNGSQKSQIALDLTLLVAYQTRLATRKQVIVQTVYVLDGIYHTQKQVFAASVGHGANIRRTLEVNGSVAAAAVSERRSRRHTVNCVDVRAAQIQCFEEADQVLWQARTFATEWRGSLNTHLRFGSPAVELSKVVRQEQATVLIVGCHSVEHALVQKLTGICGCPVIGIPTDAPVGRQ
jgi:nucleotide-binding universal stress UspA family protein